MLAEDFGGGGGEVVEFELETSFTLTEALGSQIGQACQAEVGEPTRQLKRMFAETLCRRVRKARQAVEGKAVTRVFTEALGGGVEKFRPFAPLPEKWLGEVAGRLSRTATT